MKKMVAYWYIEPFVVEDIDGDSLMLVDEVDTLDQVSVEVSGYTGEAIMNLEGPENVRKVIAWLQLALKKMEE